MREHRRDLERADKAQPRHVRGLELVMSRPLNVIRPPVGATNFDSMLKQVVLPAPFGPISAWIVPRRTEGKRR